MESKIVYAPETPVSILKGVGESRLKALARHNIDTFADLLGFFPSSYRENVLSVPAPDNADGVLRLFRFEISSAPASHFRGGVRITRVSATCCACFDGYEKHLGECPFMKNGECCKKPPRVTLYFFNSPYIRTSLSKGDVKIYSGVLRNDGNGFTIFSPHAEDGIDFSKPLRVAYPVRSPLTQKHMSSWISSLLPHADDIIEEDLPERIIKKYALMKKSEAVKHLHAPESRELLERARERIEFGKLFAIAKSTSAYRSLLRSKTVPALPRVDISPLADSFGFSLTDSQKSAISDISADMYGDGTSAHPCDRLLQGDVGSGKTAVAFAAAYIVLKNRLNAALMAPTEILARQHFEKAEKLFSPLGIKCRLITAATKAAERKLTASECEEGGVFLIGTHALISKKTDMSKIWLSVVDEQHRFGVLQRDALRERSDVPHKLMMTATPIPRTLAMFFCRAGSVSVLDAPPSGRKKTETVVCRDTPDMIKRLDAFTAKQLEANGRAYIVCPLIDDGEDGTSCAVGEYTRVCGVFSPEKVVLLHGKLSAAEKEKAMESFASGEKPILVTTSVIEVGIDVPEATLIIIKNAERFGLAQLHQLRGRVGRGKAQSYCVLVTPGKGSSSKRLGMMKNESDGFRLAQYDMETRGPGDFLGTRQSGEPLPLLSSPDTLKLLQELAEDAEE